MSDRMTGLTVPDAGWYADRGDPSLMRWWDGGQWTDDTREIAGSGPAAAVEQPVSATAFGLGAATQEEPAAAAIPAGWYPDNADVALQRWWDGTRWTAHTAARPAVAPTPSVSPSYVPNPSYAPVPNLAPASGATTALDPRPLATSSLIVGLISILINPLLAGSVTAIVLGIVALRRARYSARQSARRGFAIAGIAVAVGAIALDVVGAVAVVNARAAAARYDHTVVQEQMRGQLQDKLGVGISRVDCPVTTSTSMGSTFRCTAVFADDGSSFSITATFTSDRGDYTWRVPASVSPDSEPDPGPTPAPADDPSPAHA